MTASMAMNGVTGLQRFAMINTCNMADMTSLENIHIDEAVVVAAVVVVVGVAVVATVKLCCHTKNVDHVDLVNKSPKNKSEILLQRKKSR